MPMGTVGQCRHCGSRIYDNPMLEWRHVEKEHDFDHDAEPEVTQAVRDMFTRYEDNLNDLDSRACDTEDEYDYHLYDKAVENYDTLCHNSAICYTQGCFASIDWCAYCDEHCADESLHHRNHAEN